MQLDQAERTTAPGAASSGAPTGDDFDRWADQPCLGLASGSPDSLRARSSLRALWERGDIHTALSSELGLPRRPRRPAPTNQDVAVAIAQDAFARVTRRRGAAKGGGARV